MPSTVVSDISWNPESRTLSVWFRPSGRRYDYLDVPFAAYDALRRAPVKGRHFNLHIRDRFAFVRAERAVAGQATGPDQGQVTAPAPLFGDDA